MKTGIFFLQLITMAILILFFISSCRKTDTYTPVNNASSNYLKLFKNSARSQKPNIVLIIGDDVGYEVLTCNGGQSYSTPNLDFMASQGMRFTQCHASCLCSPSRFMLLTGKYNFRNYNEWGQMGLDQKTIGNMMKDAGYATCFGGKWQLGNGDTALKTFGFNEYLIWNPFGSEEGKGSRYKNPLLYEKGQYLPHSVTKGKYGDDMFTNFICQFVDDNMQKPMFVVYSMALCHTPESPTPDDPEFANWNPDAPLDTKFFPSMVNYMDKKIGKIMEKVTTAGIADKTIFIYVGDNGTAKRITSIFNGEPVQGGKNTTTEFGTHVPLIIYGPGKIPHGVNNSLIDFTDFLPTLADIAGIPKPHYGNLDGLSFYPLLFGKAKEREWIFNHFQSLKAGDTSLIRWVQNKKYKLYGNGGGFFNIKEDVYEQTKLTGLTEEEKAIKESFKAVLKEMH